MTDMIDWGRWVPDIVLAAIAGLLSLVRAGDLQRMNTVEKKMAQMEEEMSEGAAAIRLQLTQYATEQRQVVSELRSELNERHNILMVAIVSNGKK